MLELTSNFYQFELEHSLFELTVNGVPIWERLRFGVFRTIQQTYDNSSSVDNNGISSRGHLRGFALFVRNIIYKNPYLSKNHDMMFVNRSRRKKMGDEDWWDIYMDPIYRSSHLDYIHFEKAYNLRHRTPTKTDNVRYLDFIEFGGTLQRKAGVKSRTLPSPVVEKLQEAEIALQNEFNVDIDLVALAQRSISDRNAKLWMYRRLIKKVDPKIVILVCSYGDETLIEACQKEEIPVIELQHGVIYEGHPGYSYPGSRTKMMFPDYLLVWGDYWKNTVEYPIPNERVIPVGYPYIEQSAEQYEDVAPRDQILFISQGTIGAQLSKFALEIHKHPEINHDIVYKLHPSEYDRWKEEYPWLVDADFEVVDDAERQLYQLFAQSSAQVGVYSTAIYEGLYFGLETYLYDCPNAETLQPLINEQAANLVASADQLSSHLGNQPNTFDREYYFATNATERVCETLNRLTKND